MSAMKWIHFHPEVHMFVWWRRDGERSSVHIAERDNPNKALTTVYHTLQLIGRLTFNLYHAFF